MVLVTNSSKICQILYTIITVNVEYFVMTEQQASLPIFLGYLFRYGNILQYFILFIELIWNDGRFNSFVNGAGTLTSHVRDQSNWEQSTTAKSRLTRQHKNLFSERITVYNLLHIFISSLGMAFLPLRWFILSLNSSWCDACVNSIAKVIVKNIMQNYPTCGSLATSGSLNFWSWILACIWHRPMA